MPATFEDFGVRFLYPDNWQAVVDEDERNQGVTLQLPSGGFCSILCDHSDKPQAHLIDEFTKAIQSEYGEVETESIEIDPFFSSGMAIEQRFYYLDLLIVSRTIVTYLAGNQFIIQFQAESRSFDENEPVLAAIMKQLREFEA